MPVLLTVRRVSSICKWGEASRLLRNWQHPVKRGPRLLVGDLFGDLVPLDALAQARAELPLEGLRHGVRVPAKGGGLLDRVEPGALRHQPGELGRASCRERV